MGPRPPNEEAGLRKRAKKSRAAKQRRAKSAKRVFFPRNWIPGPIHRQKKVFFDGMPAGSSPPGDS